MQPYIKNYLEHNIISVLRHLAAISVIFSHSFILYDGESHDPVHNLSGIFDIAEMAVMFFFAVSGRLILISYENSTDLILYYKKRFFRVIPGLSFCILITLFFGCYLYSGNFKLYFLNVDVITYLGNIVFIGGYRLPFIFDSLPYPFVANGSLWTLKYEVFLYLLLPLIFFRNCIIKFIPLLVIFMSLLYISLIDDNRTFVGHFARFGSIFILASYCEKTKFVLSFKALFVLLLLAMVSFYYEQFSLFKILIGFIMVFILQYLYIYCKRSKFVWSKRIKFDFSYGIYIYAFFIQQTILLIDKPSSPYFFFIQSFIITFLVASFSWYFIESPFLNTKKQKTLLESVVK